MPLLAASLESLLVFVVIIILSGLSNWLKERQTRKQQHEAQQRGNARTASPGPPAPPLAPPPIPGPTPQPPRRPDWEEELRRLLYTEDELRPSPPPPPPPAPPRQPGVPPRVPQTARTGPPPLPAARSQPRPAPPPRPALEPGIEPIRLPPGTHFPGTAPALDGVAAPGFELAPLVESAAAFQRARGLADHAESRLQQVLARAAHSAAAGPCPARYSPEVTHLRDQLSSPRTAREVILATVVLGAPKAFD
jgi:hypothetical protein